MANMVYGSYAWFQNHTERACKFEFTIEYTTYYDDSRLKTFHLPIILESYIKYSKNNPSALTNTLEIQGLD